MAADNPIVVRITVDDKEVASATTNVSSRLKSLSGGLKDQAEAAKLSTFQTQQLTYQLHGFVDQVVSGGNPIQALIVQGSQLSATFGGVVPTFRALLGAVNPLFAAIGAGATVVGLYGLAAYQGAQQSTALAKALSLTGNAAGETADSVDVSAKAIERLSGGTIGQAREALQGLIETGEYSRATIDSLASAAIRYADVTGKSLPDVIKQFASMRDGVTAFAANANKQLNYLTGSQYSYLRSLEAQGKSEEAARYNADLLNATLAKRQVDLGTIETLLKTGKKAWSDFWDAALGVGRPDTLTDRLNEARVRLESARRAASDTASIGPYGGPRPSGAAALTSAEGSVDLANHDLLRQADQAMAQAAAAQKNQLEILHQQQDYQQALTALAEAGVQQRLALAESSAAKERIFLDRSYDENLISISGYEEARYAIEKKALQAQQAALQQQIALEKKRAPASPADELQQRARLIQLDTQQYNIRLQLLELDEKLRKDELLPDVLHSQQVATAQQEFNAFERAQTDAIAQGIADRREKALAAAQDLVDQDRSLSISLIKDSQARGEAEIQADADAWRKRLDLASLSAEERKRVEDDLAEWIANRQKKLADEAKPEWQRLAEEFSDTTELMRKASNEFADGFVDQTRDAFVEFGKTGKLSVSNLLDFIRTEFLKLTFNRFLGAPLASFSNTLFNWLSGGSGAGGAASASSGIGNVFDFASSLLGSANGNAFVGGRVQAFAAGGILGPNGGLLTQPTVFPMAGGLGIGGEAGVEAVMPLTRGPNGKLGVMAQGGSKSEVHEHYHFETTINGDGVSRNMLVNAMGYATDVAVAKIKDMKRRGDRSL